MVNEITINFDGNSNGVYHPNQTIALLIEMRIEKTIKKAKGLRLKITGLGAVKWSEGGSHHAVTYEGEQVFINWINYFFGKEGKEPVEVSAGVHLYKFSNRIPRDAAGSFEGKFGFIRYKVEVNLDIPYMPDLCSQRPFIVVRHEDLNRYPELKLASEVEEATTFCCCFCESDPVMVRLLTLKSGFVLGEKVTVTVQIFNRSSRLFSKSTIALNRIESYHSYTPLQKTKKNLTPVCAVLSKGVDPQGYAKFEETLTIPKDAVVSNDRVSNVFQIKYEIRFYMKSGSSSLEANLPVSLGHVGFRTDSSVSIDSSSLPMDDLPPFCKKVGTANARIPQRFEFIL